ncbi:MAG: GGDEF domain-containing protein [Pseudomonadota bacterium]
MLASLEFQTMLFMSGLMALALSLLLLAIHARTKVVSGLKHWVYANFCIGVAIILFIQQGISIPIRALVGGLFMVCGLALYFISIRLFEERPLNNKWIQQFLAALIASNLLITFLSKNEYVSVVVNTALCVLISFACAIYLLHYSRCKRSAEYRFTGGFFVIFAGLTLYRLYVLCLDQAQPVLHLTEWTLNEVTFLACMISVLAINFGFILMVNEKLAEMLAHTAGHDWLTGVMNRRNLEQVVEDATAKSARLKQSQAMLLMDLDKFKLINDTYGHLFGDTVIQSFAELAKSNMREIDLLGRYGGEEFCIVMPDTTEQEAALLAERIRKKFETTAMPINGKNIHCTVSIGVCDSNHGGKDFKSMFAAADQALYAAKKAGRNTIILYSNL